MSAFSNFVGRVPCGIEIVFRNKIAFKDSSDELMRARRNFSIFGFLTFRHSNLLLAIIDMMATYLIKKINFLVAKN